MIPLIKTTQQPVTKKKPVTSNHFILKDWHFLVTLMPNIALHLWWQNWMEALNSFSKYEINSSRSFSSNFNLLLWTSVSTSTKEKQFMELVYQFIPSNFIKYFPQEISDSMHFKLIQIQLSQQIKGHQSKVSGTHKQVHLTCFGKGHQFWHPFMKG